MEIELKRPLAKPAFVDEAAGEDVYRVHKTYGTVEFRVPTGTPVKQEDSRWGRQYSSTDPRQSLPSMEVRDGALVIPICDVIDEIVSRSAPADIAKELWQDQDVRDEFAYCMSERYSEGGVVDADRRRFLAKVQSTVHSAKLDELAAAMHTLEYAERNRAHYFSNLYNFNQLYRSILEWLEDVYPEACKSVKSRWGERIEPLVDARDFEISGRHWNESQQFWRREVLRQFPLPVEEPEESSDVV